MDDTSLLIFLSIALLINAVIALGIALYAKTKGANFKQILIISVLLGSIWGGILLLVHLRKKAHK